MLDFLGIGAQKAGTTWLYEQFNHHPQLAFPLGKEAHFWNRPHDMAAVENYLDHFARSDAIAGEITPAYSMLPVETIREIHRHAPRVRLLYVIRNPVERAWSAALMALQRSEMTLEEASDQWFCDHFHSAGSRRRGDYQTCLETWRSVFPDPQLLILRFERIAFEPELVLNHCFQHLGAAPQSPSRLRQHGCREPVFVGPGHALRPSLKKVLKDLYQPRIERLATYLALDLSAWLNF
ncbi:MAG: sulfotransferase domain-containing protein [Candidatus Competibacteraceae bacterium]|jgi:hypothetical protein|nr:sulfotransferase domain-containing protein [Candidatus Competibacteraceae bacterium]MBK7982018.1 sulfotransferase domain-containing protein [Candidatus Competibacteraceae bacterium]MBK8899379.1 sulfotransferase domain-containing protein [Candidatus Competibacteraceae bacterium]MBK8964383.1 sulfotransferase domain-containing protein [Candidatus Competibacteraceae bacterium]MBK9952371.1 sulfotransferase domain-containing protein [Candidatus Competibacteraceae bacterium]